MAIYKRWRRGSWTRSSACATLSFLIVQEPRLCARSSNPTPVLCLSQVREYKVPSKRALGPILLIRLHKEPYSFFPENMWYCNTVRVTSPEGNTYCFPCYRWIQGYRTVDLSLLSAAQTPCDDSHYLLQKHRREELVGDIEGRSPPSRAMGSGFLQTLAASLSRLQLGHVLKPFPASWGENPGVLSCSPPCSNHQTPPPGIGVLFKGPVCVSPEYVTKHWQEDAFFGYQYLNGFNPVLIRKCTALPENFPVTQEMVAGSLGESTSLQEEGSIYIADYKLLEDIPTTKVNGHQQYIAAPLCLLHQKPSGEVVPLAIQLSQHPGPDSPIFLPSDSEWLWTLAKTWVRNSEFHLHEVTSHLLRAHLLAEVFAVATQRQLPMCHPLYKLLIPHVRFSIHIDVLARTFLISPGGVFDRAIATGRRGLAVLLRKALENLTYRTLCLPDDIQERGVASLRNYYYRDDGLKIWAAIERSLGGKYLLSCWCGLLPSGREIGDGSRCFFDRIVFICKVWRTQRTGGNFLGHSSKPPSNYDFDASAFTTLPIPFQRPLGTYPDEHFTEHGPKQLMAAFQDRLAEISQEIEERNRSLSLSYNYMYPPNIENSTAI
uniref:Arachidonate lipoxygenase 3 n=1 Tax=Chelonoidis abingdonii TaxID=106734 RepID=A0A8C0GUL0_CHEAB